MDLIEEASYISVSYLLSRIGFYLNDQLSSCGVFNDALYCHASTLANGFISFRRFSSHR